MIGLTPLCMEPPPLLPSTSGCMFQGVNSLKMLDINSCESVVHNTFAAIYVGTLNELNTSDNKVKQDKRGEDLFCKEQQGRKCLDTTRSVCLRVPHTGYLPRHARHGAQQTEGGSKCVCVCAILSWISFSRSRIAKRWILFLIRWRRLILGKVMILWLLVFLQNTSLPGAGLHHGTFGMPARAANKS